MVPQSVHQNGGTPPRAPAIQNGQLESHVHDQETQRPNTQPCRNVQRRSEKCRENPLVRTQPIQDRHSPVSNPNPTRQGSLKARGGKRQGRNTGVLGRLSARGKGGSRRHTDQKKLAGLHAPPPLGPRSGAHSSRSGTRRTPIGFASNKNGEKEQYDVHDSGGQPSDIESVRFRAKKTRAPSRPGGPTSRKPTAKTQKQAQIQANAQVDSRPRRHSRK